MAGHTSVITQLTFVGDDRLISTADDGTIRVWHVSLGEIALPLHSALAHRGECLAVFPTYRQLACLLETGPVQLRGISRPSIVSIQGSGSEREKPARRKEMVTATCLSPFLRRRPRPCVDDEPTYRGRARIEQPLA